MLTIRVQRQRLGEIEIVASALNHGLNREQILATLSLPYRIVRISGDLALAIGGDHARRLIEIITADRQDELTVIHAMPSRSKFFRYL